MVALLLTQLPDSIRAQERGQAREDLRAAKLGDADAQSEVGVRYAEGKGLRPDQRKAVFWFRRSAEQGNVYGACNLGLHYGRGVGLRRDVAQAMKWSFIANALSGLKCNPGDFIEMFSPSEHEIERGWDLAIAWLRARPQLMNSFHQRPWLDPNAEWPVTVREHGRQFRYPVKPANKDDSKDAP